MGAKEQAVRLPDGNEVPVENDAVVCYWKDRDGCWWVYLPFCGAGMISKHTVTENADGTITVTPSIWAYGHHDGVPARRHGWLTGGVWEEC